PRTDLITPYINIVRKKATARRLMRAAEHIQQLALDDPDNPELAEQAEQLMAAAGNYRTSSGFVSLHDAGNRYVGQIEQIYSSGGRQMIGVPSYIRELDHKTLGFQKQTLYVLAGQPSMGKTTLAFNCAENIGRRNKTVGVISIEMSDESLAEKSISRGAKIDSMRLRSGHFNREGWHQVHSALTSLIDCKVYICDEARMNVPMIRARFKRLKREQGLDLGIIDYLQLMRSLPGTRYGSEYQTVSANIEELKMLSKELD